ncbi:hypothetical protein A2331_01685 [Candidatus Falkowbacteria bacterium RIFOXYB2_FULL_34_18]|uniref:Radical SAM core domain-containing protein n=1 Tax=Candidatus Falkowbacteria bacterium RIFOXYD2_FULL_34_120 TaxID=1798007 RepID=A0A1F5TQ20_9BACT|nr:MAG: hypothetical protein A2331_01685 [Candidatus Falkowbacteria bacterium RIFOXYB2_FULL_34_18]OGF29323.1 MAG: hypothetical protein A2500_05565 [Candidatus Falkowbacteria bacterium RIFOXYC12_FULL_34_55]OGF36439.1 MAG: hypothetical protein A2466_01225 [Candidatus Falkowbacteria bacterium RIFOXYC2_FULL_34_220]OGF38918.1 MAG: hypothetical protein A2515_05985 [Candidatus Falkowbacteria bacterium RIFOXYD12_FULL_34_57]OGF40937.1 MAG: hypothetical protein A2531_04210 [Candidatus Falkowbacteria bact
MGNKNNNKKNLLVLTGFRCNNNCIVCSIADCENDYQDRSYNDITKDLKRGFKNGCDSVEFTGGEPTIRADIIKLVKEANDLGYKTISLSTNGRFFAYDDFCEKIINTGLNKVTFSLLGPNKETHDAITRTPGSFGQILTGIKNVQRYKNVHVNISTVISRLNYGDLLNFGNFILSIGVKNWYLLDLIPDGGAKIYYSHLVVRLKDLYNKLNGLIEISDQFNEFGFFDFPFCLFSPEIKSQKNIIFVNTKMRDDTIHQVGYDPKRIIKNNKGKYFDTYRVNIDICRQCQYHKECGGIWKEYLNLFGDDEIRYFVKSL